MTKKAIAYVKSRVGDAWDVFPSKFSRAEILIMMEDYATERTEAFRVDKLDNNINKLNTLLDRVKKTKS